MRSRDLDKLIPALDKATGLRWHVCVADGIRSAANDLTTADCWLSRTRPGKRYVLVYWNQRFAGEGWVEAGPGWPERAAVVVAGVLG